MKFRTAVLVTFLIAPALAFAATDDFARSLVMGMRGEDVRALQIILNVDPGTRVAVSGAGSPGNETDYFGSATRRALIKFQEKYRAEILTPISLTAGTGFFGEKTRAKASALRASVSTINPAPAVENSGTKSMPKIDVHVMFPSQYSGTPGTLITISGMGFTNTDNTIYFGADNIVTKASSWNGQSITLKVPQIHKGNYHLWVKNAHGESGRDAFFVVTDGVTPEPKIESVSPTHGGRGTTVTLMGVGFTAKGNTIRTGTNIVEDVASLDGRTLSITLPVNALPIDKTLSPTKTFAVPVWVYVVNENGVSNGKSFTLEL